MATKRMFSREIVGSDAFIDMPVSSQLLYFHLGMEADDDGFIGNPKKICKIASSSEDDLKILLSKRFLLAFPSGVVVVKHHRMNNNWDKYNCKRTVYLEEFGQLYIKENRAYTLDKTQGLQLQSENSLKTVFRIEENRIDKNRIEENNTSVPKVTRFVKPTLEEVSAYCIERKNSVSAQRFIDHYESNGWKVGGKGAMKDWKASVRTWERNNFNTQSKPEVYKNQSNDIVEKLKAKTNKV